MSNRTNLPERQDGVPAEQQGIFRKFEVRRVDSSDMPGGKHHGCEYFVLDVDHDPCAVPALAAYADAVEATHPALAADMRARFKLTSPKAQRDELLAALRTMDKAAMDVVWAQNHHDASVAVHWLGEAAKASHAAIAKAEGKEGGAA